MLDLKLSLPEDDWLYLVDLLHAQISRAKQDDTTQDACTRILDALVIAKPANESTALEIGMEW